MTNIERLSWWTKEKALWQQWWLSRKQRDERVEAGSQLLSGLEGFAHARAREAEAASRTARLSDDDAWAIAEFIAQLRRVASD